MSTKTYFVFLCVWNLIVSKTTVAYMPIVAIWILLSKLVKNQRFLFEGTNDLRSVFFFVRYKNCG